jgi:hypothetical protein
MTNKKLQDIIELFKEYTNNENQQKLLDKITSISTELCMSPIILANEKIKIYTELLKYDKELNLCTEILAKWRDSLAFLRGVEMENTLSLLIKIISLEDISSHERIYTAVHLYNNGFVECCYQCFSILAFDKSMLLNHRLEAAKFLFAAEEKEKSMAQECILDIVSDHIHSTQLRYNAIVPYLSRTGVSTLMNMKKLKIPYNEDFVLGLQMPFFQDVENDIKYRILSGQFLLQTKNTEIRDEIVTSLFGFAKCADYTENVRADAADVLLRLGNSFERAQARQIITELGFTTDKRRIGPKTIYDNSQNIHNESIDKHVEIFLEKMLTPTSDNIEKITIENNGKFAYRLRDYDDVKNEITSCIRKHMDFNAGDIDAYQRNKAYEALIRIGIDTATFTKFNATTAEILVHVWSRIHSGEFDDTIIDLLEQRMLDELTDMSETCSTGYAGRFVNVLSTVDDTLHINWDEQLMANVDGRMQAKIRDCKDQELRATLTLGMMAEADKEDKEVYLSFIKDNLIEIEKELHEEFVDKGYLNNELFNKYINDIKGLWIKI